MTDNDKAILLKMLDRIANEDKTLVCRLLDSRRNVIGRITGKLHVSFSRCSITVTDYEGNAISADLEAIGNAGDSGVSIRLNRV